MTRLRLEEMDVQCTWVQLLSNKISRMQQSSTMWVSEWLEVLRRKDPFGAKIAGWISIIRVSKPGPRSMWKAVSCELQNDGVCKHSYANHFKIIHCIAMLDWFYMHIFAVILLLGTSVISIWLHKDSDTLCCAFQRFSVFFLSAFVLYQV